MRRHKTLLIIAAVLSSSFTARAQETSTSKVLEKTVSFPSPIQWKLNGDNRNADISLTGVAWGPVGAPELISRTREPHLNQQSEQFPDRWYVIGLGFQARIATPLLDMRTRSGLVLTKDSDGNVETPWDLTSSGLLPTDYDIHFSRGNVMAEYWDFFPVAPGQKEFLFQVHSPAQSIAYFRVIRKDNDFVIVNSIPEAQSACLQFEKSFGGNIGADTVVSLQITRQKTILSGTEQYATIGKPLWLTGVVDSLGHFIIEERYPKDRVTAVFKGKFDVGYRTMAGYFSKPDGTELQPFDFHELQPTAEEQVHPQNNCD
jgi:hypothetical protein